MCTTEKPPQPTPEKRIQMFLNLAHQYEVGTEWARSQETNTYIEQMENGEQERKILTDSLYAGRLWRLGLLRKFIVSGETVYVPKVLEDLNVFIREQGGVVDKQRRIDVANQIKEFKAAIGDMGVYAIAGRCGSYRDVMTDLVYGAVLHADTDKYERLYDHNNFSFGWSKIVIWLERSEKALFKAMSYLDQFCVPLDNGQRHIWPWGPPVFLPSTEI